MADFEANPTRITGPALAHLLERRDEFLGFLSKRVGSRDTAEDLLQAAFVRSIERGGDIRDQESVVAWFYRLLRNAVIDHYRRQSTTDKALTKFARELEGSHIPSPDLHNEVCECVSRIMQDLKPEYRDALTLVDLQDRSLTDLAANACISAGNAAVRVHRARQALHKQVMLTCGVCAQHGCVDCRCKSKCSTPSG